VVNLLAMVDPKETKIDGGMAQDVSAILVTRDKLNFAPRLVARSAVSSRIPSTFLCGERRQGGADSERGFIRLQHPPNRTIIRTTIASLT
jgi:hypothetical protein